MAIMTVRLDAETAALIERAARETGRTRSDVLRDAVRKSCARQKRPRKRETLYDKIKDLIGSCDSGGRNFSTDTGRKYAEMLINERRARVADRRRTANRSRRSQ